MEKSNRFEQKAKEFYDAEQMSSKELYESLMTENTPHKIYGPWYEYLYSMALYRYYLHSDLKDLLHNRQLPVDIKKDLKYGEFKRELSIYKLYATGDDPSVVGPNDTYYDKLYRAISHSSNNTGFTYGGDWIHVNKRKMDKEPKSTDEIRYKLYLPIANEDLQQFALMLMLKGYNTGLDFDYKFNDCQFYQRCDNVVIYPTAQNINDYINAIDQIMVENPEINVNTELLSPFGIHHDDYMTIAPYLDAGGDSLSSITCRKMLEFKEGSSSYEEFKAKVDEYVKRIIDEAQTRLNEDGVDLTMHRVTDSREKIYKNKKTRQ